MRRSVCALLAATVVMLALPSTVLAADVYHFRGKTASASFYTFDAASCIRTSVALNVYESRIKSAPGAGTETAWADVIIYHWNNCTSEESCSYGGANLSDGDFQVRGNLASATLNTEIELFDCFTGVPQTVPFAITWTGVGEVESGRSHSSYHYPGYRYTSHSDGQSRYAAVSGSITIDGVNLIAGAESNGSLTSSRSGSVTIQK